MPEAVREAVRQVVEGATLATTDAEIFACKPAQYTGSRPSDRASIVWQRLGAKCMESTIAATAASVGSTARAAIFTGTPCSADRECTSVRGGESPPAALLPLVPVRAYSSCTAEGHGESGRPLLRHHADLYLYTTARPPLVTRMLGASAPRVAEQYVGQLQMFSRLAVLRPAPQPAAGLLATEK